MVRCAISIGIHVVGGRGENRFKAKVKAGAWLIVSDFHGGPYRQVVIREGEPWRPRSTRGGEKLIPLMYVGYHFSVLLTQLVLFRRVDTYCVSQILLREVLDRVLVPLLRRLLTG